MEKELEYLDEKVVKNPAKPFVAIIGGAKVSSKISVLESLLEKVDKLIVGGGMAYTFLKAKGLSVGTSLIEEEDDRKGPRYTSKSIRNACLYIPAHRPYSRS